jgi:hypothetical protein
MLAGFDGFRQSGFPIGRGHDGRDMVKQLYYKVDSLGVIARSVTSVKAEKIFTTLAVIKFIHRFVVKAEASDSSIRLQVQFQTGRHRGTTFMVVVCLCSWEWAACLVRFNHWALAQMGSGMSTRIRDAALFPSYSPLIVCVAYFHPIHSPVRKDEAIPARDAFEVNCNYRRLHIFDGERGA